ncbi:hypothetical protein [Oryzibacter oryziterrae]|uniref:hypothetical protein n=1 Tax=Oryzibacter oryziterrae TaxID=2766474 RepID=UPI001F2E4B23|nr:hypothetical protein [Oryzibacter oryziterrae]
MSTLTTPEAVVAAQLLAYNAKDLEALLSLYAEDAEQYEHPNTLLAKGATPCVRALPPASPNRISTPTSSAAR